MNYNLCNFYLGSFKMIIDEVIDKIRKFRMEKKISIV